MRTGERNRFMKSKIPQLPEDIVVEILSRLPVRSLLQFRSVSKHWQSLISHKNLSLCNDRRCREKPLFFRGRFRIDTRFNTYFSLNHNLCVEEFDNPFFEYDLLGSCDGLLLFCYGKNIYLWNPSTKYSRAVHHLLTLGQGYRRMLASGFYYNGTIGDYKIIIIISLSRRDSGKIYAFASYLKSTTWTKIKCPFEVQPQTVAPLVNGNLHFVAREIVEKDEKLIACFDAETNAFKLLPKPEAKRDVQHLIYGLGVIEGCLSMVRPDKDCKEILSMKEYGVKESWTIMFTIVHSSLNVPGYSLVPVFLTNKGEVLMVENYRKVMAYDLKTKSLNIIGLPVSSQDIFGFTLVESLADGNKTRPPRKKRNNRLDDFIYFSYLDLI